MDQQLVDLYKRRPEHMKMDCAPSKRPAVDSGRSLGLVGVSQGGIGPDGAPVGGCGALQGGGGEHTCRLDVDSVAGDPGVVGDQVGVLGVQGLALDSLKSGGSAPDGAGDVLDADVDVVGIGVGAGAGSGVDVNVDLEFDKEFGDGGGLGVSGFRGGPLEDSRGSSPPFTSAGTEGGVQTDLFVGGHQVLSVATGDRIPPLENSQKCPQALDSSRASGGGVSFVQDSGLQSTDPEIVEGFGVAPVGGTEASGDRFRRGETFPLGSLEALGSSRVQGGALGGAGALGFRGGALDSLQGSAGRRGLSGDLQGAGQPLAPLRVQGTTLQDSSGVGGAPFSAPGADGGALGGEEEEVVEEEDDDFSGHPNLVVGTATQAVVVPNNHSASSLGTSVNVGIDASLSAVNVDDEVAVDCELDMSVGTQDQSHDDHRHSRHHRDADGYHQDADQDYSVTGGFVQHSQLFEAITTGDTLAAHGNTGASASTSGQAPQSQLQMQMQLQLQSSQQQVMLYHQPIVDRTISSLARPSSRGSIDIASDCGDVKRQIIGDENLTNSILKELVCPICLEYFYFPVTVSCGHTYCRYCIGHAKLAGKLCPLCRQPVGKTLNINTILSSLVKILKLRKRTMPVQRGPEMTRAAEKLWWDEHCLKPFVSMPLFLRIMFGDVIQSPVFFDDLCTCLLDYFSSFNKWSKCKWIFTIDDCREVRRLVGFDHGDPEGTFTRLHNFVEDYLMANPHLSFRVDPSYPILLKVYHDFTHKIDGTVFSALDIQHKLPWDVGRHAKSLLHLPHSSVSLSHLLFAQCPRGEIGLLDVGSTIGTMLKLQQVYALQDGDRIHVGDKHEVDIKVVFVGSEAAGKNNRSGALGGAGALGFRGGALEDSLQGSAGRRGLSGDLQGGGPVFTSARGSGLDDPSSATGAGAGGSGPVGPPLGEGGNTSGVRVPPLEILNCSGGAPLNSVAGALSIVGAGAPLTQLASGPNVTSAAVVDAYHRYKWDPCTNQVLSPQQIETLDSESIAQLQPIESTLWMTVHADQSDVETAQVPPKGLVVGRGPTVTGDYAKLSITTQNGYISREHCLLFYDGSQPAGKRWLLRDMSTLGTFLKLKPFQEPTPIKPGQLFKVGQCKVEVCDANDVNKRVPSPAAIILSQLLQSHLANAQGQNLAGQPQSQGQGLGLGNNTSSERDL